MCSSHEQCELKSDNVKTDRIACVSSDSKHDDDFIFSIQELIHHESNETQWCRGDLHYFCRGQLCNDEDHQNQVSSVF
jgi:hypothetical protein